MANRFTEVDLQADDGLEEKLKCIFGSVTERMTREELYELDQFNETSMTILRNLLSYLLSEIDSNYYTYNYKEINDVSEFEPIFFVKPKHMFTYIIIFNRQKLSAFYNSDSIVRAKLVSNKILPYAFMKNNAILEIESDYDTLYPTGLRYFEPYIIRKLVQLYVMADHAAEHFYHLVNDNDINNNHSKFGKNITYVSGLITSSPKKENHSLIHGKIASLETNEMFILANGDSDDDSTSCSSDD
jgi:hypothetical protein